MRKRFTALSFAALASSPVAAEDAGPVPQTAFERLASWEGRWSVTGSEVLEIVFDKTARGHTMVERWETASGLHSMTVYHRSGDTIVATHYCPQGNQPRLVATATDRASIDFTFLDITGFDAGESHAHSLSFAPQPDGSLRRTETYVGPDGPGDPTVLTLIRSPDGTEG